MRIIAISDTHGKHDRLTLPEGDILVHAGDFTNRGGQQEIINFNAWLGTIRSMYSHVIVVAGNHDFMFEQSPGTARALLGNATYLENSEIVIDGVRFYGSPVTPVFYNWAFNRRRGAEIDRYWQMIPYNTNVLITHGPPYGIGDINAKGEMVGCTELRERLNALPLLRAHIFGHIHEGYGMFRLGEDSVPMYVNASVCLRRHEVVNAPVIIDL